MILLEYHNVIIFNTLTERFFSEKPEAVDMTLVDFDGVTYKIITPEDKTHIKLSMNMRCYKELIEYGANDVLKRVYGDYLQPQPEVGYDVTLAFDLGKLPASEEEKNLLIKNVSLLKRNALAAPFERAFEEQEAKKDEKNPNFALMTVRYREEEAIYVRAQADRVTVIFSTVFKEETDRIFGKVFLQEFVDARRNIQLAPPVLYSNKEPPLEIRDAVGSNTSDNIGYITFVLFPRHVTQGSVREETISRIQLFRDYLHYHIKCSKAYMHTRMRARVQDFLKVLNRAKPEIAAGGEKKTATGKTFRRA